LRSTSASHLDAEREIPIMQRHLGLVLDLDLVVVESEVANHHRMLVMEHDLGAQKVAVRHDGA